MSIKEPIAKFKKVSIWILIVATLVLAAVGVVYELVVREQPEEEVVINPVFDELPEPIFPVVSGVAFAKEVAVSMPQVEEPDNFLPGSFKVYRIASQSGQLDNITAARRLAFKLGFEGKPQDTQDAWVMSGAEKTLLINKENLSWDLEMQASVSGQITLSKEEVLDRIRLFLVNNNLWQDVLGEAEVVAEGFDVSGVVVVQPTDPENPDLWEFGWQLKKDGLDIYSPRAEYPLSVRATKYGDITKMHYGLGEIQFEVVGEYPARSLESTLEELIRGRGALVEVSEPGRFYSSVTGVISALQISQVDAFYYQDLVNGYLVPVWEVEGGARLEDGRLIEVKVWVNGISPEWVR